MQKNIIEFLNWYYLDQEHFFITLINNKNGKTSNYHHNVASFIENIDKIAYSNEMLDKSVYFSINSFKSHSKSELNEYNQVRKTKSNVNQIKSIVFDFDEVETSKQDLANLIRTLDLIPSYILETSKNKFQVCYKLNENNIDFRTYELINKTLATKFKSDINVCSVEKVFRFPHFVNRKNDFETKLLKFNKDVSYDFSIFENKCHEYIESDIGLKSYYDSFYSKFIDTKTTKPKVIKPIKKSVKSIKQSDTIKRSVIKVDDKLIKKYRTLLKYNHNDASLVDFLYIKERAKKLNDFDVVFDEILSIRDILDKPLKRDIKSYYEDKKNLFYS